jgi:hypothetical protein
MVSVLASSAGGRGFKPRYGQTKYYEIGICCFFAKQVSLRGNSKTSKFARNHDILSEWGNTSVHSTVVSVC